MPPTSLSDVVSYLRRICAAEALRELPDAELLRRFQLDRDEAACSVLVQRHGPMVLAVCRRVLGDLHSAEDAAQATFLVLVRRAGSVQRHKPLSSWLHGVARRIALRAKADAASRRNRERQVPVMVRAEPLDELTWQELRGVLDEAIGRLPAKYQAPIVLCHLQSKSYDQAAKELGLSKSTLSNRITRARELLREQLTQRGIALSAGVLATVLAEKTQAGPLGAMFAINTLKAAMGFAAGKAAAGGCVSASALALAQEALKMGLAINAKVVLAVLVISIAVGGASLAGFARTGAHPAPAKPRLASGLPPKLDQGGQVKDEPRGARDLYGDPLPEGASARLGTVRFRGGSHSIAYALGGKVLVSLTGSALCFWDAATGQPLHRIPSFDKELSVSPDGKTVIGAPSLAIIEVATGKELRRLQLPKPNPLSRAFSVAFSPDGNAIAVGGAFTQTWPNIFLVNATSGKEHLALEIPDNRAAAQWVGFSSDGRTVLSHELDRVRLLEVSTGKERGRLAGFERNRAKQVTVSPAGNMVAAQLGTDGRIRLWDGTSGNLLTVLNLDDSIIFAIAFSGDGKLLASIGSDCAISIWDVQRGNVLRQWQAPNQVAGVSGLPDGGSLFSNMAGLAFSPDNRTLASWVRGERAIRQWEVTTGKELHASEGHTSDVVSASFSRDGKTLYSASADGKVVDWDVESSRLRGKLFSGSFKPMQTTHDWHASDPWGGDLASDGLMLAAGSYLRFTRNGNLSDRANADGVRENAGHLFDTRTGKELLTIDGKFGRIWWMKLSPNGKQLAALSDKGIGLWDLAKGDLRWRVDMGLTWSHNLTFSPSGALLALKTASDNLPLYDTATGKEVHRWDVKHQQVYSLAFSHDGQTLLATGQPDRNQMTLDLLRLSTVTGERQSQKLTVSIDNAELQRAVLSPSGNTMAAYFVQVAMLPNGERGHLHQVHLIELRTGQEFRQLVFPARALVLGFSPDGRTLATGMDDSTTLLWDMTGWAQAGKPQPPMLDAKMLEQCWSDLAGTAAQADRALWALALTPKQSLPFLKTHLTPPTPADAKQIAKLVAELGDQRFAAREKATQALEALGEAAEAALNKALQEPHSPEVRQRLEQILSKRRDNDALRPLRAIDVLEQIGDSEARQVLQDLASASPNPRVVESAKAALQRLASRPQ